MTLDDVRKLIESEKDSLQARGVRAVYVFGSIARGEGKPGSDVDIIVDYDPNSDFNLIDLSAVHHRLSNRFGVNVDVVTRDGIHRRIREDVLKEAVRVM